MDIRQRIIKTADQCVQCGLCSQHCPTYLVTHQEAESARGRISLIKALAENKLNLSDTLQDHLHHCLDCRACEAVCPAQVKYGQLIDDTRAFLLEQQTIKLNYSLPKILKFITFYPFLLRFLRKCLYLYQKCGAQFLIRKSHLLRWIGLHHWDSYLPRLSWKYVKPGYYATTHTEKAKLGLFMGCISSLVDMQTLRDTIKVLNDLGYSVFVPARQGCCGALHLHSGDTKTATHFRNKNINSFASLPIDAIITCASGCGVTLQEYPLQQPESATLVKKVYDINYFLNHIQWPEYIKIKPLAKHVALHLPCSLRNVMKQSEQPLQLLQRIPQLKITVLNSNNVCCGAAGAYFLQHPQMANTLVERIVAEIKSNAFDILASTNIGCQLHIAQACTNNNVAIDIVHPVSLLAKQMRFVNQ